MSATVPTPSLEPYLRARAINPSLIPSQPPRTARTQNRTPNDETDFLDFLRGLARLVLSPITIPTRIIQHTLTSPLTISLVLKLVLLGVLTLASAGFSIIAVGAFWYSWGSGGLVEVEGWLIYGSKALRTPHTLINLPVDQFHEDLRYDVQVEMDLVRPPRGTEEMGNFMLSLELRSSRNPLLAVMASAQPSLPPPSLPINLLSFPAVPISYLPPCILPWPFRSFCPSRLLGYSGKPDTQTREHRTNEGFNSRAQGKDVVRMKKDLLEGVVLRPARGGDAVVGSAFVSIGREDSFTEASDGSQCPMQPREVRTTGLAVVRFVPRPTGIRWLLASHPLPPLLLLPPISLTLTLSSSFFAFLIINYLFRTSKPRHKSIRDTTDGQPMSEEALLAEKRKRVFEERDHEERREAERRRNEWEEVESSALGGLRRMPEEHKRSRIGESTIGGSETTAPMTIRSFGPIPEASDDGSTETTITESSTGSDATQTGEERSRRASGESEGWEDGAQ